MNQPASHGVKDGLEPVVCPEFLIDGVEVVSQRRQRDTQLLRDLSGILRSRKKQQNALLLIRQGVDRCRRRLAFPYGNHLPRQVEHL